MKRLLDLTECCCRWPVGRDHGRGRMHLQMFCGSPRALGDWFCPDHMRSAFPHAVVRPAQVKARNLVTIKLALMRRRPAVSREELLDELHHNADLLGRQPMAHEIQAVMAAPESDEVAAERARLLAEVQPIPAAQTRAADEGVEPTPLAAIHDKAAGLRSIEPINLAGLAPTTPTTTGPIFEWVDPASLLVNETYQRDLSERSIKLIRRIVDGWNWTKFKPPVCSLGDNGLEVIDGQHTAIAAASHPHVSQIPVMIVETETVQDRASAFIGQNTDRLGITKMQLHRAAVAAGDEEALTIEQVCQRSGVHLLMAKPHRWKTGDSLAVSAIGALIDRRGAMGARRVMELLVQAESAPVTQAGLKAVEMILFDPDYAEADQEHLADAIKSLSTTAEREAATFAAAHRVALWKALGIVWFRKCRKVRRVSA